MPKMGEFLEDLAVMSLCVAHGTKVTDSVLQSVWRWFADVEIVLPIPVMRLSEEEWRSFTLDILSDLTTVAEEMAEISDEMERIGEESEDSPLAEAFAGRAQRLDLLWRELAGCLAEHINSTVPERTEEEKRTQAEAFVEHFAESTGHTEEEFREYVKDDPVLRMYIRMSGLNPDDMV